MKAMAIICFATGALFSWESFAAGKMMTRGEAVNACKTELRGQGGKGALPQCVTAKLDAARSAGLHPARTGRQCRYSTLRTSC